MADATNLGEHGVFVCLFTRPDKSGALIAKRFRWRLQKRGAPFVANLSGRPYAPDEIPVEIMAATSEANVSACCAKFGVSVDTVPFVRIVSPLVILHNAAPREIEDIDTLLDLVSRLKQIEQRADPAEVAAWKRSAGIGGETN